MVVIERSPGQSVRIGPYALRVLAIHTDEVVVALLDLDRECHVCGKPSNERRHCPQCDTDVIVCPECVLSWACPWCASLL